MNAQRQSKPVPHFMTHYVYELVDHEGEVFYVGKGSGTRAMSHLHAVGDDEGSEKARIIRRAMENGQPLTIRIVEWFRHASDAFAAERQRIKWRSPACNWEAGNRNGQAHADRLREVCGRLHLTAAEIASIVGRDKRNVNRWLQVGPPPEVVPLLLLIEEVSQATGEPPIKILERMYSQAGAMRPRQHREKDDERHRKADDRPDRGNHAAKRDNTR